METIAEYWPFEAEQQNAILLVAAAALAGLVFMFLFALVRHLALLPEAILRLFSGWSSIATPIVKVEKAIRNLLTVIFLCSLAALLIDVQIHGLEVDLEELWEEDLEDLGEEAEDVGEEVEEILEELRD